MKDNRDDELLRAKVNDAVRSVQWKHSPRFVGFLDEYQSHLAAGILRSAKVPNVQFWGGYEGAERTILGVFPWEPESDSFPVTPLSVRFSKTSSLSHRDFLGALLSLGLQRNVIGDILPEEGRCVLFVKDEIADFICTGLSRVGGVGVICEVTQDPSLPSGPAFEELSNTIASERLDCVLGALLPMGRERCQELIRTSFVQLNHQTVLCADKRVAEGDKISVRGTGKFIVDQIGPITKKGRLRFIARKYR
jgi:RNA-binding protein YlmH